MSSRRFVPARELRLSGRWSLPLAVVLWFRVAFAVIQLALVLGAVVFALELFV